MICPLWIYLAIIYESHQFYRFDMVYIDNGKKPPPVERVECGTIKIINNLLYLKTTSYTHPQPYLLFSPEFYNSSYQGPLHWL